MARQTPLAATRAGHRCAALLTTAFLGAGTAHAIDIEPGGYTALPPGRSALGIFLVHAERDARYANGEKLPGRVSLDSNTVQGRFLHYLEFGGYTLAPGLLLSCGQTQAGGDIAALGDASGCADPIVGAVFWAINRPAEKKYLGITPYLAIPIGHYDRNQPLNFGENRWKIGLNSGAIAPLPGRLWLDAIGDILWYGANDDYLGNNQLEQDVLLNLQLHLRYPIGPTTRLSMSYLHDWGGETTVNGVAQRNAKNQGRFRVGVGHFFQPNQQLQLEVGADTQVENGFRENLRIILRYVWLY